MAVAFGNAGAITSSAAATSLTPALPTFSAGDLFFSVAVSFGNATITWPAGWTKVSLLQGASGSFAYAYRVSQAGDTAPAISFSVSAACSAQVWSYTGENTGTPIGASSTASSGTTATHTTTSLTTTAANSLVIYVDLCETNTNLTNPTQTPPTWVQHVASNSATSVTAHTSGDGIVASSGTATGATSATGGAARWASQQVEILAPSGLLPIDRTEAQDPHLRAGSPDKMDRFWAQSRVNRMTGTMLPRDLREATEPHLLSGNRDKMDRFWSQSLAALLTPTPPDTTKIFRGHLRSLPDQPYPINAWQSWTYWNINLYAQQGPWQVVYNQFNWPLPVAPPRPDATWSYSYNLNLIGKDVLPTGQQTYNLSPIYPPYINHLRTWTYYYNLNLIGQDKLPVGDQTWVVPTPPYRLDQTWTYSYNLNLIGKDKLPTGVQASELPPRDFARLFQTWISITNLALTVTPPVLDITKQQRDWPVPKGAEPDWRRSWEWQYNKNLIGQDQLPFRQQDWPNPTPPPRQPDLIVWVNSSPFRLLSPFAQLDWPNPTPPAREPGLNSWTNWYNLNLIGQDQLPSGARSTDLTPPDYQRILQTWIEQTNIALFTVRQPFNQTDWPLTPAAPQPALGWQWAYNLNLIGKDVLPKNQKDWPNPLGHTTPRLLQTWADAIQLPLIAKPFSQTHWPNPAAHTVPTLLQTWLFGRANLYPIPQPPPGDQFFDRPQLRTNQPADQFFAWARYPIIPPPGPPPVGASYFLLQPHVVNNVFLPQWSVVTEGIEIPFGWVPTLAVDPLNTQAVNAFYAAGPRPSNPEGAWTNYQNWLPLTALRSVSIQPSNTHWVRQANGMYALTGLGAGLPPIGV